MKGRRDCGTWDGLTPEQVTRLTDLVESGLTDGDVAAAMGIARTTVIRHRQALGLKPGHLNRPMRPEELLRLRRIERAKCAVRSGRCLVCGALMDLAGEVMPPHPVRRAGRDPRFAPECGGSRREPRDLDKEFETTGATT